MNNNLINIEQNEVDFQKAWDNYWHTDTTKHDANYYKKQMDIMWLCVWNTCSNLCKSIYKKRGVIVSDLDEVITDATEYSMRFITGKNRLKRFYRPRLLSSFCFLRCRYIIDSPKRTWYDKNVTSLPRDNYKDIEMDIDGGLWEDNNIVSEGAYEYEY